jgi:hypothetical protein
LEFEPEASLTRCSKPLKGTRDFRHRTRSRRLGPPRPIVIAHESGERLVEQEPGASAPAPKRGDDDTEAEPLKLRLIDAVREQLGEVW